MPIIVTCECGRQFQTNDENAGRRARCPDCGRELIIPKPGQAESGLRPEGVDFAVSEQRTSGKAITSLVLGIASFFCCLFTGLPAIIFGVLGLGDINSSRGWITGKGIAIAGIITGLIGCTLSLVFVVGALFFGVPQAREAVYRAQCTNNLKQIGLAMHAYLSQAKHFPPAAITDKDGKPVLSWRVAILPFIEQASLYHEFHLGEPWDSPHNKALLSKMPAVYRCPSVPQGGDPTVTIYQVFVGPGTLFDDEGVSLQKVTDGTSNTLMVVESKNPVPWTKPDDLPYDPKGPRPAIGSKHPGGFNALFADGAVRFINDSISDQTLKDLITRAGGEVVRLNAF